MFLPCSCSNCIDISLAQPTHSVDHGRHLLLLVQVNIVHVITLARLNTARGVVLKIHIIRINTQ